ncbi:pyridoxamine 5'-phosphate oxidase family protein [Hydrocarboniphaga effusa]|jgi:predicted pyridoxine 5'-phosphate oxidase superfamily flavin-nucleotide-binding protein|uniref:pyridoxamine 5'-phosphate oxidase family protein n=1 Tax=Hydrocarboniphaga effusa TaxID=243629 RepID=UPI003BA9C222
MSTDIADVAGLEACIGKTPGPMHLKVIDHLDAGAQRWAASSPFCFAAFGNRSGESDLRISACGGEPGFTHAMDASTLALSRAAMDDAGIARIGQGFGALFLTPGIGETLRVNGRVAGIDRDRIEIAVEECFVHCAKALIRSGFWSARPATPATNGDEAFLFASRFMALATMDAQGHADVSPKGDPQGALLRLHEGAVWYADRPGNRRADGFRNILTQPRIAAVALIPGSTRIALVSGIGRIGTDARMRELFAVEGKTPIVATRGEHPRIELRESQAVARARLWPVGEVAQGIDPAALMVAHVKHSKHKGLQASLVRAAISIPGFMEKGLAIDYKRNLY